MSDLKIDCPHCGESIELTEALAGPMLESERRKAIAATEKQFVAEKKVAEEAVAVKIRAEAAETIADLQRAADAKDVELVKARDAELAAHKAKKEADDAKRDIDLEVARRVEAEAEIAAGRARTEAEQRFAAKLKAAEVQLATTEQKCQAAEEAELLARTRTTQAEEAMRQAELTVARRLDEERSKVREQALKERDDEYRLKVADKDKQLADLKEKLDDAQRKADQGSQQSKGEVLELDLYDALSNAFPADDIERVKKGQKGGDVIHTVRSPSGLVCGRIKWESKRTQKWTSSWLPKLREDQRAAKCDLAALMTETLPDEITHFDVVDDVWVSGIPTLVPMAAALRRGLIDTATARRAAAGADSKKDVVYGYLTGSEFRARVRGVIEPLVEMRESLDSEKRAVSRQFAVREKQLDRMGLSLSGMYGDLQGIVGPSLPVVEGLALPGSDDVEGADVRRLESDGSTGLGGEVH